MASLLGYALQSAVFLIFIAGLYEYLENNEKNGCEMTYMFEQPEYLEIELPESSKKNFSRFRLYLYGEGVYAYKLRNYPQELEGIPVLFIPGNAGSYKQVRSLGSVALRMGESRGLMEHFNYFSVDFNEELYAFYGGLLDTQTEFVHLCVKHILSLYKKPGRKPKTVVLVGHSMGGLLARALYTLPQFDKSQVNLIYTQATPHRAPIVYSDFLPDYYRRVNLFWMTNEDSLRHVTVLSSGGGDRDLLVNYHLTTLNDIVNPLNGLSVNTKSVPKAWVSTDHLCAVWCKQMVLATVRSMYDLIDPSTKQISASVNRRMAVLKHHFLHLSAASVRNLTSVKTVKFDESFEWDNLETDHFLLHEYTSSMDKYFAFVIREPVDSLVLETNIDREAWVFGCKIDTSSDSCSAGDDLTSYAQLLPSSSPRYVLHLGSSVLKKYSHIVFHIQKSKIPIFLHAAVFNQKTRSRLYNAPTFTDLVLDFPRSLYHHSDVVISRAANKTTYEVVALPSLKSMLQVYTARVDILSCEQTSARSSVLRLHLPWSPGSDLFGHINPAAGGGNLIIKLEVPPGGDNPAELHLYLQPSCEYRLSVDISFLGSLGQFGRHYAVLLPAFVVANLFMVLCHQLFVVSKGHLCPTIMQAQDAYGQPWKLALIVSALEFILSQESVLGMMVYYGLPATDGVLLTDRGIMFPLLHLCLYSVAFVLVRVYANVLFFGLCLAGAVMRFLFHRIFTHHTIPVIGSIGWWVVLVSGIYSSWHYCGSIGLLVTYLLLIADIMSSMVTFDKGDRRHVMWYMQQTMLMLTVCMFLLSLPEFASWLKNYRFSSTLAHDPSRYPSIVIATSLMLVRFNTDHENWHLNYAYSLSPVILSVGGLLYAVLNIWRLNVIIPTVFVWIASIQTLGIILHRQKNSDHIIKSKLMNSQELNKHIKKVQ